jgi:transposase
MPRERSDMRRIREVLRLRDEFGASVRRIVAACRMPRTTVRDYLRRLESAELRFGDVREWSDAELERRLFPPPTAPSRPLPDWAAVERDLGRRGVTLHLLWQEYLVCQPDGYRYTQFVQRFRDWQAARAVPRLRRDHLPGDALEVDYAGMTLMIGVGAEARPAQVFVACLPYSGYIYAEATWTQRSEDWLASHVRLLEHIGGVPARLVPDNLKVGVSHASFYDPAINPGYRDLAQHYRVAVVPTRVRQPRDKAAVENAVLQVERRVLAPVRDTVFVSLDAANAAIRERLATLNAAPLSGDKTTCRTRILAEQERAHLRPLPADRFVPGAWSRYKLAPDYHVVIDGAAYSVPYTAIGKAVDVHATAALISIFLRGRRIACHARAAAGSRTTLEAHQPASHRAVARYTPEHLQAEFATIGSAAALLFERILAAAEHREQAVRAGLGLLRLGGAHGAGRLEQACQAALEANVRSWRYVQRWLATGDPPPATSDGLGEHANLRGPSYYRN